MIKVTLNELGDRGALSYGDGYRTKRSEHGASGYRILRVTDVGDGRLDLRGQDFVRKEFGKAIGPKLSEPGDVLLTTKGTVGRVAIMPETGEPIVYSPQLCYFRVRDADVIDGRYLAYWFKSEEFLDQAAHRANNTDMAAYINLRDIGSLQLKLPQIHDQRAIAGLLGALDDKIAANDQLARLVDELAASVFSRVSTDSSTAPLSDIADVNLITIRPATSGRLRYIDISAVGQGTYKYPGDMPWDDAPGRARRKVRAGDTIWSTVRPNRRSHALVLDDDPLLIGSTGLAVLSPKPGRVAGVYEASQQDAFVAYLESVAEGSAYPAVRADRFLEAPVPDLEVSAWEAFERQVLPLRVRAHAAASESRILACLRDELLPLLLSGRVSVRDAEMTVSEAV